MRHALFLAIAALSLLLAACAPVTPAAAPPAVPPAAPPASPPAAAPAPAPAASPPFTLAEPILVKARDIPWGPAPASLPAGAQFALLEGNLAASGPFTFRLSLPAGYILRPHRHPVIEHVTVISGKLLLGVGEQFDLDDAVLLTDGGFAAVPPGQAMFGKAEEPTIIQVHSIAPWGITYLDPEDDPRTK
jgi:hypothetical protein